MRRNRVLLASAVIGMVFLSGCSLIGQPTTSANQPTVLQGISVANYDDQPHTIAVVVLHNESVVDWERQTIRNITENGRDGHRTVHGFKVAPPALLNSTKEFTLLVRVDNSTEAARFDSSNASLPDCYHIDVKVGKTTMDDPVSFWIGDLNNEEFPSCPPSNGSA